MSHDTIAYLNVRREHILDFPVGVKPSSLKFEPARRVLGFVGMVWDDESFENVSKRDEDWEKRGNTGIVWDDWPIR